MSHLNSSKIGISEIPFLYRKFLLSPEQCIEITKEFWENPTLHVNVDSRSKVSIDICRKFSQKNKYVSTSKSVNIIWDALGEGFKEYRELHPTLDDVYGGWKVCDEFNFQFYHPGQGFANWHVENIPTRKRIMVWTIYLSNCEDGGTEFRELNHIEKCEMGKLVIFPADWTFSHRSQISHTKHKFIATGWVDWTDSL
tara:strand:+ start:2052 stop:2642 length:591 start_codon:yes stop_codon:yes gene_type:complete